MSGKETQNFRVVGIDILNFNFITYPYTPELIGVQYQYNIETRVNEKLKQIINAPEVKILDKNDTSKMFAHLSIALAFDVDNFDEVAIKIDAETFNVDFDLDKQLSVVGLHTLRGVAFSLLKGTYLQGAILPIVQERYLKKEEKK